MIHITQLIFVIPGKEEHFHAFEDVALPLMAKYNGEVLYRIRPTPDAFIDPTEQLPYEVHVISFPSEEDLQRFLQDDDRKQVMHMKDGAVRSTLLIKGQAM